jgi:hypothetical protein
MSATSDNSIHTIVVTTTSDLDDRFNRHERLRVVFERALIFVGGQSQPDQFVLEYNNQPLTELDQTLGDLAATLGWGDEVTLELVPNPSGCLGDGGLAGGGGG